MRRRRLTEALPHLPSGRSEGTLSSQRQATKRFEAMAHARNHRVGRRGDVRNREKEADSEEPELAETRYAVTDYEVIQNADVDQREGLAQSAGDELVGLRR